jgi:hypothetical protein
VDPGRDGRDVSTYRYLSTDVLTGQVIGDWLPMTTQNFTRTINTVGTYTGSLMLNAGATAAERRNNIAAIENEKTMLWIFQDQVPVWNGIIWDWPHQSILDNTMPISASTPESLFQHRLIEDDLTYTNMDVFDVFRALAAYALAKQPNGQMAGFTMGSAESGIIISISYVATDLQFVYDAMTTLITTYAFEYSVRPAIGPSGNLYMSLDLGYPALGLPQAESGLAYNFPGNLLDYQFTRTGSTAANDVIATASSAGTDSALNATPTFGSGTGGWTGANGAEGTLTTSTAWSDAGDTQSLQFTGNGTTANPLAQTELIAVTGGTAYTWACDLYSPQGWPDVLLNIAWYAGGSLISTVSIGSAVDVTAATEASGNTMSATAPANADYAAGQIEMAGTPAATVQMLADTCVFAVAVAGSGNWQSSPAAGLDTVTLGAGYPLLETSVSMTTLTVTQQSQIDAYAGGQLAQLTGTQLTPMLTLAADQVPAAKDIVLGSYCQFNATSPLHPANDDGSPGLQVNGRVIGWTLYPPSGQQTEYTQIQLGEIEDINGTIYIPYAGAYGQETTA